MDLLLTLYATLHLANPYAVKPMPEFPRTVVAQHIVINVGVQAVTRAVSGTAAGLHLPVVVQQPTNFIPPSKDSEMPSGDLSPATPENGGQLGYQRYCPDGAVAQGSCQTPGGDK